jgi:hypothetical protein
MSDESINNLESELKTSQDSYEDDISVVEQAFFFHFHFIFD